MHACHPTVAVQYYLAIIVFDLLNLAGENGQFRSNQGPHLNIFCSNICRQFLQSKFLIYNVHKPQTEEEQCKRNVKPGKKFFFELYDFVG